MRNNLDTIIGIHSLLRYLVLIFTLATAMLSLIGMLGKKDFTKGNKMAALFMMISCDTQLLVGLVIYFISGQFDNLKNGAALQSHYNRFYAIEHPVGMILGIVLVHLGYAAVKKNISGEAKLKRLFWYSFLALFIFVAQIPWPQKKDVGKPLVMQIETSIR